MNEEYRPTPRREVALWVLVALAAVAAMVGLGEALRHDHPAAGVQTPELTEEIDPLREDVPCELPAGREGADRPVVVAAPELPQLVNSNELYDCPATWDGRRVRYVGEVVGAVLERRDGAWVQLNDDVYADGVGPLPTHRDFRGGNAGIGVRMTRDQAARIDNVGGATQRGDLVEVVAEFRRVDPETAEVAILHVETMRILRRGEPFDVPDAPARPAVALVAALGALTIVVIERRRRER
ncbi:hypothetical protein DVS28_a3861 [Euzebya pacifica]|uniref:Uncharacterized protein n=1 Tax=Euzebya pacifica TaxID=1608957 RepID=A0A346Y236_9ACTN|nr:hypothetical protein [Euzebya pacifica]AXV08533.1 hypothetical protein DVS28_a3861 [Euzebya pacifica]